jgi:hypothetical protein
LDFRYERASVGQGEKGSRRLAIHELGWFQAAGGTMGVIEASEADRLFGSFSPPDPEELGRLEQDVYRQLRAPHEAHLKLLGSGEFTIAVAHPREAPRWACKRMPPASKDAADRFKAAIERYTDRLRSANVRVVPTSMRVIAASTGGYALYLCQPVLPAHTLLPNILRERTPSEHDVVLVSMFEAIKRATSPTLGVDGQAANWAWVDGEPWDFDISTPMLRGPDLSSELDLSLLVQPYPGFVRPFLRRWVGPPLIERVHDLRMSLIDAAAMLAKDKLCNWLPASAAAINRLVKEPVSVAELEKYYASEASLWVLGYRMKRLERRLKWLSGKTYQYLIPSQAGWHRKR